MLLPKLRFTASWSGAILLATAFLAGCASGGKLSMVATISTGEKIPVPLGPKGVEPTKQDGVQIEDAGFTLNAAKNLVYRFEFSDAKARALRSVRVEDVSDDAAVLLV